MFGLILSAAATRRAVAVLLFALAVATTGAAAASVYIVGSGSRWAAAGADDASNAERILLANVARPSSTRPAEDIATSADQVVTATRSSPGFTATTGMECRCRSA